jgi:hypothetical protein
LSLAEGKKYVPCIFKTQKKLQAPPSSSSASSWEVLNSAQIRQLRNQKQRETFLFGVAITNKATDGDGDPDQKFEECSPINEKSKSLTKEEEEEEEGSIVEQVSMVLGAVYMCPIMGTNCHTIPCTICIQKV